MTDWLREIRANTDKVDDFYDEYSKELPHAKEEIKIDGPLEGQARKMAQLTDKRFSQLQDIEAIYDLLDIELKKLRSKHYKSYLENYNRALSSRDVEKYIDGEYDVVDLLMKINKIRLLRNKFASITKGMEVKHFQLTNIIKMRVAGLDDSDINY